MAEKDKDFQITSEEADRIKKAMKNEKFRQLLSEYVDEISDPQNRAEYEEQLTKLEKQRGVDLKFIQPIPGFVMKMFTKPEGKKVFINVCQNKNVKVATPTSVEERGEQWMIPYSLTPPREDLDKAGKLCSVIDAVFNPETYKKGQENPRFKQLLVTTVLDGIEDSLHFKLDRENIIYLRMPYKGMPTATVIREKTNNSEGASAEDVDLGPLKVPYPPLREELEAKSYKKQQEKKEKEKQPSEPEYSIIYRGEMTMQDFTNERSSSRVKRPKELVVSVHLPGVDSAKSVELDIFEKRLLLQCNKPHYELDLALPYPINDEKGSAKFNKSKKSLIITLPVLPQPLPPPPVTAPPTARPLVSELSPSDTAETSTNEMAKEESHDIKEDSKQEEPVGTVYEVTKDWSSKGEWQCPPFSYRQDENSVYFVLQTPGVKRPSMAKHFDEHQVQLTYSTNSGQNYSFFVGFSSGCGLDCDDCSMDISEENVVLVLVKSEESSSKTWKSFTVGLNAAQSTEKLFLTTDNVESAVEQLTSLPDPWVNTNGWSDSAQFEVVALSDSHMEVKVTDPDRGKNPSSKAVTATAKDTTRAGKMKKDGPSSPCTTTKQGPKSPTTELQQRNGKVGETSVKPSSEVGADTDNDNHSELTPDMKVNPEGETEPDSVVCSLAEDRVESIAKEEVASAELLEKGQSEQGDGDIHMGGKEKSGSKKKKGFDLDSVRVGAAADPNLLVKEDGSVFVKVDKNYSKTSPLDRVTQRQESKGNKFQFSNQLAFSLD